MESGARDCVKQLDCWNKPEAAAPRLARREVGGGVLDPCRHDEYWENLWGSARSRPACRTPRDVFQRVLDWTRVHIKACQTWPAERGLREGGGGKIHVQGCHATICPFSLCRWSAYYAYQLIFSFAVDIRDIDDQ
jgi:hypothetical protein